MITSTTPSPQEYTEITKHLETLLLDLTKKLSTPSSPAGYPQTAQDWADAIHDGEQAVGRNEYITIKSQKDLDTITFSKRNSLIVMPA